MKRSTRFRLTTLILVTIFAFAFYLILKTGDQEKFLPPPTHFSESSAKALNFITLRNLPEGEYKILEMISRKPTGENSGADWISFTAQHKSSGKTHNLQMMIMQNDPADEFFVGNTFTKGRNNDSLFRVK